MSVEVTSPGVGEREARFEAGTRLLSLVHHTYFILSIFNINVKYIIIIMILLYMHILPMNVIILPN